MLKKILLALIILVALLVLIGFLLPSSVAVERSTVIEAPICTVFAQVNVFTESNKWSPWSKIDPDMEVIYEGAAAGVGSKMSWKSEHPQVGNGSQEIVASEPFSTVKTKLDFGPNGTADAQFQLEEVAEGTKITWGFTSEFGANLIGRYMGLMFDSWIGADYERGLANLKERAESLPQASWCDLTADVVDVGPVTIAYVSSSSGFSSPEIAQALAGAYGQVMGFIMGQGLEMNGSPVAIARSLENETYTFDAGVPISEMPAGEVAEDSPVQIGHTQGGLAVRVVHRGPYSNLTNVYEPLDAYLAAHGLTKGGDSWEEYVSDPAQTSEDELITNIYQPISRL